MKLSSFVSALQHRSKRHRHTDRACAAGQSATALAALGRPTGEPRQVPIGTGTAVEAALRALPSPVWTQGMFGQRGRCRLVLSQLARVPYRHLATLTGDVTWPRRHGHD